MPGQRPPRPAGSPGKPVRVQGTRLICFCSDPVRRKCLWKQIELKAPGSLVTFSVQMARHDFFLKIDTYLF